jgi:hypothetical protein
VWQRTGQQFNVYPSAAAPNPSSAVPQFTAYSLVAASAPSSTVWRFFSTAFAPRSAHFYTADVDEYNALVGGAIPGWQLEGPVFSAPMAASDGTCPFGSIPVYRLYNNGMGGAPNHRLITDINEHAQMLAAGWVAEGYGIGVTFCSPQ